MISTAMAQQLNITKTGTGLQYTESLGSHPSANHSRSIFVSDCRRDGNPLTAYGFYLDSLLLRTEENTTGLDSDPNNLNFLHVPVLVNDITSHDPSANLDFTLDGVFGMNLLTATYDGNSLLDLLLGNVDPATVTAPGAFSFITFKSIRLMARWAYRWLLPCRSRRRLCWAQVGVSPGRSPFGGKKQIRDGDSGTVAG